MKRAIMVFVLLISACASNTGVISLGDNSYIIAKQAATGFPGTGAIKTEALKEAAAECRKTSRTVKIDKLTESQPPYLLGNYPKVELIFHCIKSESN